MKAALGLCLACYRDRDDFRAVQTSSFGSCQSVCYRDGGEAATDQLAVHTSPIVAPSEDLNEESAENSEKKVSTEGADPVEQGWHQPLPSTAQPRKSILKKR